MTAYKGLGTYGDATGVVTNLDHKLSNAALLTKTTTPLVIRPGLFYAGSTTIVTGTAGMAYSVAAFECATQRSAAAGAVLGGNDGSLSVATTAAPGSNSRYDVVYIWHREYELDGTNSNPVIGVVQGTAAASPTVPSLAAYPGAIELARILVPAGVTATNSGTTITQTAPFTSVDGGTVPFRTTTEMNVWTTALTGQLAIDLSSMITYRWSGSAWQAWSSGWITYTPTWTVAVGSPSIGNGSLAGRYRWKNGLLQVRINLICGSTTTGGAGIWTFGLPSGITTASTGEQILTVKAYSASAAKNFVGFAPLGNAVSTLTPFLPDSTSATGLSAVQNGNNAGSPGTGVPLVSGQYTYTNTSNMVIFGELEVA